MIKIIGIAIVVAVAGVLIFAATKVVFTLAPEGDSTEVTWAMQGPVPYMAKVVHVFFDMDSMVGKQFETGLANLKTLTEK